MNLANFKWDQDSDGIVTLLWDMPGRTLNVLSMAAVAELAQAAEALATDASLKGLILTSGKTTGFCAGADLSEMEEFASASGTDAAKSTFDGIMKLHRAFRRFETAGKPVVAAINGVALGGGLEVTLACHYRIVADDPRIRVGFPEAQIGLIPGGGGTQRAPRLMSAMQALPFMLESRRIDAQAAKMMGLVHDVAPAGDLVARAKAWIKANPKPVQPWDRPDFRIPGGGPFSAGGAQVFTMGNAMLRARTYDNYPAQRAIMSAVYEGLLVDIDTALKIEARHFVSTLMNPVAKNMIRTLFHSMQDLGKGARRPAAVPPADVKRLGVLGAGVMGAGIAYVSAMAGIDVILIDVSRERAQAGKDHAAKLVDHEIQRGRSTPEKKTELLSHIEPSADFATLKDVDLVIEAVFEDRQVKAEATKKADAVIGDAAIFGSNTSTLPITGLAEASTRPKNFIGIHFFSPVERMALVEIIRGRETGERALATAMDYVRKIRKTPIVVNDSRGFYTSRCFSTFTQEGLRMITERIAPSLIDNCGRMAGMPMGSLEVLDTIGVDTALKITRQTRKEVLKTETPDAEERILAWLVEQSGRPGVKAGKGFYDYDARGKRIRFWAGTLGYGGGHWRTDADPDELKARLILIQVVEAARCFEEGVVTDPRDADVGAILGWGFAPFTGGPLSLIDTMGAAACVERLDDLASRFGERFSPNKLLRDMAAKGETFYGRSAAGKAA